MKITTATKKDLQTVAKIAALLLVGMAIGNTNPANGVWWLVAGLMVGPFFFSIYVEEEKK